MDGRAGQFETTAAEISRNFGQWQDRALQSPVKVTHHGRPRVVIVSIEEFERLQAGQSGGDVSSGSVNHSHDADGALSSILNGMAEGFIALDARLNITAVNIVVEAFLGHGADELIGRRIDAVVKPDQAEVFLDRYRWVLRTGEAAVFEATSQFGGDRTISLRAFPYRGGVGVIFTNLTELMALRSEQAGWRAASKALNAHSVVACAELNLHGFVISASRSFRSFIGFEADHMVDVRLSDLVAASSRHVLAQALSRLVQEPIEVLGVDLEFLTRNEGRRTMRLSIAVRRRDFAFDGFSIVALPATPDLAREATVAKVA